MELGSGQLPFPHAQSLCMNFDNVDGGWMDFTLTVDDRTLSFGLSYTRDGMPEIVQATLDFFQDFQEHQVYFDLEPGDYAFRLLPADGLLRLRIDGVMSWWTEPWDKYGAQLDIICEPSLFVDALNKAVREVVGKYGYKHIDEQWRSAMPWHVLFTTGLVKRLDELASRLSASASGQ